MELNQRLSETYKAQQVPRGKTVENLSAHTDDSYCEINNY